MMQMTITTHKKTLRLRLSKPTITEFSVAGWSIMGWATRDCYPYNC